MNNKIAFCVVLFCITCFVEISIAQATVYYQWKGGAGCVEGQATPCDFDNGDYWTVGSYSTKRDSEEVLGEPSSPALQTKSYNVIFPVSFAKANYKIQSGSPAGGYNIYQLITAEVSKKKVAESILGGSGGTQGMTLIFKDTSLPNFSHYIVGGFENYTQTLIFDNVQINATTSDQSVQKGHSIVKLTGKTYAKLSGAYFATNDTFIIDTDVTLETTGDNTPPFAHPYLGRYQNLEVYGNVMLNNGSSTASIWNYQDSVRTATATFTGANITYPYYKVNGPFEMNARAYIGKDSNDNGKITHITVPFGLRNNPNYGPYIPYASLTIGAKTESYIAFYYVALDAILTVQEQSILHIIKTQYDYDYGTTFYLFDNANLVVTGNSQVIIDRETKTTIAKKRDIQGSSYTYNFTVYDGLLQFNDVVDTLSQGVFFMTKSNSSKLIFNGNITDNNNAPSFDFASGSTVQFNGAYKFQISLPSAGVNYEFGNNDYTQPNPPSLDIADGGSIKLKGSKLNGYGTIYIEDSGFGGYGFVDGNVTLAVSSGKTRATSDANHAGHNHPKFSLSYIGKTLEITGKLTIPSSSVISVTANSTSCGKLVVGTLDISSSVSFELVFVGQPPTQNKTYVVAEYSTFTGTLPSSPNVLVYQVENDTQNKQIKVHYTYIPPPTEPVTPTEPSTPNTPPSNEPTSNPPSNSPIATASSIFSSTKFSILILLLVVSVIVTLF